MTIPDRRIVHVIGLGMAGLAGGLLTIFGPLRAIFAPRNDLSVLSGLWLGAAFAGYFWIAKRDRSVWGPIALIAMSIAAFCAAASVSILIELKLLRLDSGRQPLHMLAFSTGGAVGGVLLSIPIFLLYARGQPRLLLRIVAGGAAGAVAGVACLAVARAIAGPNGSPSVVPLMLVWQPVFGLCIGALLPPRAGGAAAARPSRVVAAVIGAVALPVLVWIGVTYLPGQLHNRSQERAREVHQSRQPSFANLPRLEARPAETVLIERVGRYTGGFGARGSPIPARADNPETLLYGACYPTRGGGGCLPPDAVTVLMTQFPTTEWAVHAARRASFPFEMNSERVIELAGHRVLDWSNEHRRRLSWASGVFTCEIEGDRAVLEDFVRSYLQRWPSSL